MPTGKEICEKFVRWRLPDATDEYVAKAAKVFWESDPSGELWHVWGAAQMMKDAGVINELKEGVMSKNDGGPAYPYQQKEYIHEKNVGWIAKINTHQGMSLRDYFAGQALISLTSSQLAAKDNWYAYWAYKVADAMLAAKQVKARDEG